MMKHTELGKKKSFVNQSNSAVFAFNWSHLRGSSCHVLSALTDCSNLQNPQIIRLNAVVVSSRQRVWMLGFTSAISDFSKLKTPLCSESLASGVNWENKALLLLLHTQSTAHCSAFFKLVFSVFFYLKKNHLHTTFNHCCSTLKVHCLKLQQQSGSVVMEIL